MRHTSIYIEMFMCKCISIQSFAFNPISILRTIFLQLDDFFIYYSPLFLFECHFSLLSLSLPSPSSSSSSSSSYSITWYPFFVLFSFLYSFPSFFPIHHIHIVTFELVPENFTYDSYILDDSFSFFLSLASHYTMERAKIALLFGDIWANVHCWSGKYTKPIRYVLLCVFQHQIKVKTKRYYTIVNYYWRVRERENVYACMCGNGIAKKCGKYRAEEGRKRTARMNNDWNWLLAYINIGKQ